MILLKSLVYIYLCHAWTSYYTNFYILLLLYDESPLWNPWVLLTVDVSVMMLCSLRSLFVDPLPTGDQTSSDPTLIETNHTGWSATPTCYVLAGCCWKKKKKRTLIGTYWKISARKKKKTSNISPIVVSRWSQRSTRNELRHRRTLHRWYVRPTITQSYWFEVIYFLALTSSKRIRTKNTARHIYYTNDKSKDWCLRLYWRTSF